MELNQKIQLLIQVLLFSGEQDETKKMGGASEKNTSRE
jgi:hypothetical protein